MTAILIAGTKTTFRWQNAFWIIASAGTFLAFIVLLLGNAADFESNFNAPEPEVRRRHLPAR